MRARRIIRAITRGESGDTAVLWSISFIILVGVVAVVIGPELGANWRDFVGKPTR